MHSIHHNVAVIICHHGSCGLNQVAYRQQTFFNLVWGFAANMPDSFYVVVAVMNINLVRVISRCSRLKCCNWNLVLLMIKKQHEINLKLFSIKMKSSWVPFPTQGMRPMSSPFMLVSYWKGLGEKPPSARNPEQHTIHCTSSYLYVTQISNAAWCSKKRNAIF